MSNYSNKNASVEATVLLYLPPLLLEDELDAPVVVLVLLEAFSFVGAVLLEDSLELAAER